ncbi:PEGA domain-containing protein [Candidatus Poribacteria bacterium]|nr:PEGA domain-containing protein [Candidatus Poribacteria bacterium]
MNKIVTFYLILFFFLNFTAEADDSLQQGINAYENGDFDLAIVTLTVAISEVEKHGLTKSRLDLVTAYKYLALALIGKGQTGKAEAAFQQAIKLNPRLKLNENEYSSKIISLFQRVRDEMVDTLTVVSTPTGTTVFVDDQREEITAPDTGILKLDALIGRRDIKVSKRYFEDKIVQVDIVKNGKNTVIIDLEPVRIGLWIKTEPSNVNLLIEDNSFTPPIPPVNGGEKGEYKFSGITPTIINTVMGAKLSVKLTKEGYRDKIVDIQLKENGVAQMGDAELPLINEMAHISITLDLLPPGQLKIASDPPNAEVYLDEELKGKTPLELNNVSAGKHRLRFQLKEFGDVTQAVEVISDKTVTVQCKLGGVLAVTSSPPGAEVYLGETHLGKTPLVTGQIPLKPHYLKLSIPGYVDDIREVVLTSDIMEIQVRLAKKTGSLTVDSNPPGAVIYLAGEKCGITPIVLYGLPIGKYDLTLTKAEYGEWSEQIQIEHREVTWKHVYLWKKR